MSKDLLTTNIKLPDHDLMSLADKIVHEIESGKQALAISINETIKATYWKIGRHIVEFEQQGDRRVQYGRGLLSNLAKTHRARVGRGYSHPNLNNMRKSYLIFDTPTARFRWEDMQKLEKFNELKRLLSKK